MSSLSGRNSSSFMCRASRIQKRMGHARNLLRTEGEKASPFFLPRVFVAGAIAPMSVAAFQPSAG